MILLVIVLIAVFLLPFLLSEPSTDNRNSENLKFFTELQKLYESSPADTKIKLKDVKNGIYIYGLNTTLSDTDTFTTTCETAEFSKKKEWNETPPDIVNEKSNSILYSFEIKHNDGSLVNETSVFKIEISMPQDFEKEKIKVFQVDGDKTKRIYSIVENSKIIFYVDRLTKFAVVNDSECINDTDYLTIKEISLKYENMLSLKVVADFYVEDYTELKILMWENEQKEYDISTAKHIGKYKGNNLFELTDIEFKDIDKTLYIKLCAKTKNGYVYSSTVEYNILQYCINLYNSSNETNIKNLVLGTICYSQMSNDYIGEKSNIFDKFALATNYKKSILETIKNPKNDFKNLYSEDGKTYFYGRNVDLNNKIAYNIYINDELNDKVKDLTLSVTVNDVEYKSKFVEDETYGFYKATFTEIQPYDINTPLFIKILDKNGKQIGGTLTDSVGTFISEGMSEYVLDKDKKMFASTIFFMNVCETYFKK
jgi:hypothetical protein